MPFSRSALPFISSRVDRHVAPRWKALCSSMKLQSSLLSECRWHRSATARWSWWTRTSGALFSRRWEKPRISIWPLLRPGRFGGQVRVIGPAQACASELEWCDIPVVPEILSPIFEIVPVQVAALRMAELRGIAPGSFRFAPQVATDESSFIVK